MYVFKDQCVWPWIRGHPSTCRNHPEHTKSLATDTEAPDTVEVARLPSVQLPVRTATEAPRPDLHNTRWRRGREASRLQPGAKGPGPKYVRQGTLRLAEPTLPAGLALAPASLQRAGGGAAAAASHKARTRPRGDPAGLRALRNDAAGLAAAENANGGESPPGLGEAPHRGRAGLRGPLRHSLTCHSRNASSRGR